MKVYAPPSCMHYTNIIMSSAWFLEMQVNNLWTKINEFEMELQEHALVLQTIEPLEASRTCV